MPPVLGPLSSSKMRLWSWDDASGRKSSPSIKAMNEASSPMSSSSMTTRSPAAPKIFRPMMPSRAASASALPEHRITPLPAANPSALTTHGWSRPTYRLASSRSEKTSQAAVGMPFSSINSLAKALLPSSLAASRLGPNTLRPLLWNRSPIPSTSGCSGPTTVRSMASRAAKSASFSISPAAMSTGSACWRMPALPGAQ